jgi:hypothetical protein
MIFFDKGSTFIAFVKAISKTVEEGIPVGKHAASYRPSSQVRNDSSQTMV